MDTDTPDWALIRSLAEESTDPEVKSRAQAALDKRAAERVATRKVYCEAFSVSRHASVVTTESAKQADFDAELSGPVYENRLMDLRDIQREVAGMYLSSLHLGRPGTLDMGGADFYAEDGSTDYRTGNETTESVHVKFTTKAAARAFRRVFGEPK